MRMHQVEDRRARRFACAAAPSERTAPSSGDNGRAATGERLVDIPDDLRPEPGVEQPYRLDLVHILEINGNGPPADRPRLRAIPGLWVTQCRLPNHPGSSRDLHLHSRQPRAIRT